MAAHFDTSYATMQLSVSAYLATTAVLQLFIGPLSDKYGRRPVTLGALSIFVLSTFGALAATSVEVFLTFRLLQAAIVTCMVLSRAVVRDLYPQDQAASMIGYVTMGMALVPMVGPMIGGALDQLFGWQSTFVFLAIVGIAVLALAFFDQGETVRGGGMSFAQQVASYPDLLTSPRFWGYALAAAFGSGAFFALLGGGSFVASEVYGLSPFWTGVALGAPAIGYAAGNGISGRLAVQHGINRLALVGTWIALAGMGASLLCSLFGLNEAWLFFGFCTFLGLGNGMLMPNATAGMLSVRPHLAGTASGLGGAILIGGGAALSQLAGALLDRDSGTLPLQWLMFLTSVLGMLTMLFVIHRARRVAA